MITNLTVVITPKAVNVEMYGCRKTAERAATFVTVSQYNIFT